MRRLFIALFLLAAAAPAAAQRPEPEWRQAVEEPVLVRINRFEPEVIRLEAGRPTRLIFYNNSRARLSLAAPRFFSRARIRSGDERALDDGGMVLGPGESRTLLLVPSAGRYHLRSQSLLRRLIGMEALILVEPGE